MDGFLSNIVDDVETGLEVSVTMRVYECAAFFL